MKLDFHVLTVLPPHNVNRDEDGRPKTAMFGGVLRGRVSSQAKKRAMRFSPHFQDLQRATRTREAGIRVYRALKDAGINDPQVRVLAALTVNHALGGGGKAPDAKIAKELVEKPDKKEIARLIAEHGYDDETAAECVREHALRSSQGLVVSVKELAALDSWTSALAETCQGGGKEALKAAEISCKAILDGGLLDAQALDEDTALFGRMVAAKPQFNAEAACAVSHAITTHRFGIEGDYFSAGEELNTLGGTGAAITSYAFFGSGVYYQHAVLDVAALRDSLQGDGPRTAQAVQAFLNGLLFAQPSGKRNSYASDVAAAYVLVGRGDGPSFNAMLAFLRPVTADDGDLLRASADELRRFYETTRTAYGLDTDYRVFAATPNLRRGNAPEEPEVWDVAALRGFVDGALHPQPA